MDLSPYDGPRRYFVIAAPPRSGSNLLSRLLQETDQVGVPVEYFEADFLMPSLLRHFGVNNTSDYIEAVKKYRTSPNGVFGTKLQYWELKKLGYKRFVENFSPATYVYLTRNDKIAQAVSHSIADQTRQWQSLETQKGEAVYDRKGIARRLNFNLNEEKGFEHFFAVHRIKPFRITYEGLLVDSQVICEQICDNLNVSKDFDFDIENAPIQPQGTELNKFWAERFMKEISQ